jgi:hypothetical protein
MVIRKSTISIILVILATLNDELEIDLELEREIKYSTRIKSHLTREFCIKHILIFRQSDRKSFEV